MMRSLVGLALVLLGGGNPFVSAEAHRAKVEGLPVSARQALRLGGRPALDHTGMYRTPSVTSTTFGDVSLFWYMNQGSTPAAPTRGHLMDHIALSVADLDAWIAQLRTGGVTFLQQPYTVGPYRAVMIEGPSREAIELIQITNSPNP